MDDRQYCLLRRSWHQNEPITGSARGDNDTWAGDDCPEGDTDVVHHGAGASK